MNDSADPSNLGYLVSDALRDKHPPAQPLRQERVLPTTDTPTSHPVVFDALDASVVRAAALCTVGAAGPSGVDAREWRRLGTSFHAASDDLYAAIALCLHRGYVPLTSPLIYLPLFWHAA